jgi:hypothetical protein
MLILLNTSIFNQTKSTVDMVKKAALKNTESYVAPGTEDRSLRNLK